MFCLCDSYNVLWLYVQLLDMLFFIMGTECYLRGKNLILIHKLDEGQSSESMAWLMWLVAGLSLQKTQFDPVLLRVGFVVNKVTLGQVVF